MQKIHGIVRLIHTSYVRRSLNFILSSRWPREPLHHRQVFRRQYDFNIRIY